MVALPPITPWTVLMPDAGVSVATEVLLLLQVPPPVVCEIVVVAPTQVADTPEILVVSDTTLNEVVLLHPPGILYVMVVAPGVDTLAVTIPSVDPTLAMVVLLLLHVPPASALLRVRPCPIHIVKAPVIAPGALLITAVRVVAQPDANV